MLTKSYISRSLNSLDVKYRRSTSQTDNLFYSKLALLELCGWLEESIDTIILDYAKKNIKENNNLKIIAERIKYNSGFAYEKNFKSLLVIVVGLIVFEKIEKNIDTSKLVLFKSTLHTLKKIRDSEAHTHLKGVTRTIDSPSKTILHFNYLYDGLLEFENTLKTIKP